MTNIQFETAFQVFTDIYGLPKWEEAPKEGQNKEKIIETWCNELKGYTVEQVKEACFKVIRWGKIKTFPTLSHLLAQLSEVKQENVCVSEREKIISLANELGQKYGRESRKHYLEQCGVKDAPKLPAHLYPEEKYFLTLEEERKLNRKNIELFKFLKSRGYSGLLELRGKGREVYDKILSEFNEYYREYFEEDSSNSIMAA